MTWREAQGIIVAAGIVPTMDGDYARYDLGGDVTAHIDQTQLDAVVDPVDRAVIEEALRVRG